MEAGKTVALTFRVTTKTKRMLEAAAARERRSLTNMFEVLVEDFCQGNGLVEEATSLLGKSEDVQKRPA